MLVPSIDLMGGQAVQLIGGETPSIEAGDPRPLADRFGLVGEVAVIDLDAALSKGDNRALIENLLSRARCRVGGGVRSVEAARRWLDAGAAKVILGTMAKPELLRELPRERVIAALDLKNDEVVVEGWTQGTGAKLLDRIAALRDLVSGFLVTFVEREGRMGGTDMALAKTVVEAAGEARVTIAGGVTTAEEIRALDALGADAQVGMALYSGRLRLADAFLAPARSDRTDGLIPTVVVDPQGVALGLVYSDAESVAAMIETGRGAYRSRSRGGLWVKGESSGAVQRVLRLDLDCDRDALRATVTQAEPGFCHEETRTCWGEDGGLTKLARTLAARREAAPEGSYTARLFADRDLLAAKLREEADELIEAASPEEVAHEAADVIFFALARAVAAGVDLSAIEAVLDRRALKVTRRD